MAKQRLSQARARELLTTAPRAGRGWLSQPVDQL